jgi:hypothetical protein
MADNRCSVKGCYPYYKEYVENTELEQKEWVERSWKGRPRLQCGGLECQGQDWAPSRLQAHLVLRRHCEG